MSTTAVADAGVNEAAMLAACRQLRGAAARAGVFALNWRVARLPREAGAAGYVLELDAGRRVFLGTDVRRAFHALHGMRVAFGMAVQARETDVDEL